MRPATVHELRLAFAAHLAVVAAIVVAAYLGALPTFYQRIPHADLFAHAVLFGLLGALLDGALARRPVSRRALPWLGAAALEELAQLLSPRRTSSLSDYAADVLGVVVLTWLLRRLTGPRAAPAAAPLLRPDVGAGGNPHP